MADVCTGDKNLNVYEVKWAEYRLFNCEVRTSLIVVRLTKNACPVTITTPTSE